MKVKYNTSKNEKKLLVKIVSGKWNVLQKNLQSSKDEIKNIE